MQFNIEVQKINHRYIEIKIVRKYPLPLLKLIEFYSVTKHVILLSLRNRKLKTNCVLFWRSTDTRNSTKTTKREKKPESK